MTHLAEPTDLTGFRAVLPEMPYDEAWELIGGQLRRSVIASTARRQFVIQNLTCGITAALRARGSTDRASCQSFYLMSDLISSALCPMSWFVVVGFRREQHRATIPS